MFIYSYNQGSQGAKRLAQALDIKRIRHTNTRFTGRRRPHVINWGATQLPDWNRNCLMINPAEFVGPASNKLSFFQMMADTGLTPRFFTDREQAAEFIRGGGTIVCRTILNGHSGNGIVLAHAVDQLVNAPLYVEYKKKRDEYRVHVVNSQVIDVQRKARRLDADEPNWQVRNHANGFIYARENVNPGKKVKDAATRTIEVCGLNFGAVDIVVNANEQRAYVLEVNTAPGLEGQTIERYATAFRAWL